MKYISKDHYKICKDCNTIIRLKWASFCPKCGKPLQKFTEEDMIQKSLIDLNKKISRSIKQVSRSLEGWNILNQDNFDFAPLTCEVYWNGKPISELKAEDL